MSATLTLPRRSKDSVDLPPAAESPSSPIDIPDAAVQARVQELLATEIAFIANDAFVGKRDTASDASPFATSIEAGSEGGFEGKSAGLPAHLARMCSTPLLSPEQERELFRRMNFCKYRANAIRSRLSATNPDREKVQQIEALLDRATNLRNHIVRANTRLVMSIARRFADGKNTFDDLLSQGISSLMHAAEKFDFDRGYRFSTYATCAVRRDLYRVVMGRKKDQSRFTTGSGDQLEACMDHGDGEEQLTEASYHQLSASLREMLSRLEERERVILSARFGLDGEQKKVSFSRLGERLGISKERVRQLANRAMDKMRDLAPEYRLEGMLG